MLRAASNIGKECQNAWLPVAMVKWVPQILNHIENPPRTHKGLDQNVVKLEERRVKEE